MMASARAAITILVNGQRVPGLGDIDTFPAEAVERLDLLPRESGARVGAPAGRRVYNIVLKPQHRHGPRPRTRRDRGGRGRCNARPWRHPDQAAAAAQPHARAAPRQRPVRKRARHRPGARRPRPACPRTNPATGHPRRGRHAVGCRPPAARRRWTGDAPARHGAKSLVAWPGRPRLRDRARDAGPHRRPPDPAQRRARQLACHA